ncbi:hypothetical protein BD289DRAFT_480510 [Coniella lustricola]|uniref:Uncharacterized protein n=1 Tax=Coniella lustricola TaxID=2025994 RepID=A0A2T3AFL3_9PEZI|nr:hypothetical protein BD289DRAFT_480510 [Coniella lustricola]
MSHGPPPPPPPGNMFSYGQMAMPDVNGVGMGDNQDMMALFSDPSMAESLFFDTSMPMNLDHPDDTAMSAAAYNSASMGTNSPAQGSMTQSGSGSLQRFQSISGDDNVPGAGPPPMSSFGASQPAQLPGGSTLTEFTKRRNWPAKVVEELKDLLMILDQNGRVKHASPSVNSLTGYTVDELKDRLLREFIHPDDCALFLSEFNECIATGNTSRLFYRMRKKDGSYAIFESVGHAHIAAARFAPNPNNQSPFCQAVFMMSRLYPAANAQLLDSFLEHKMENERLRRRIAELKREEAAEMEEATRSWRQSQEGRSDVTPSEDTAMTPLTHVTSSAYRNDAAAMPPPERPNPRNIALTRENLEGVTASNRADSIRDKMARYEGINTIEMLTGLRYQDGERARGVSTGARSPTLIKGDAGIAIPIDRDPRTGEKKKKLKVAEEYVCTDCGTLDSPEWRKGPAGPKTLCNACGLRWAKKEKKKNQGGTMGSSGQGAMGGVLPVMDPGQA